MYFSVEPFTLDLSLKYLETPVFAFDIETDTGTYHWESGDRGLAYPADITHISFYAPDLPAMVLSATYEQVPYLYEQFDKETLTFSQVEGEKYDFQFSKEEILFITSMFERENYTAIAHNLVFDARQIFGKFNITIPSLSQFWDTFAIHIFGAWSTPDEEDQDAVSEKVSQGLNLFNLTSHWLDEETREWWKGFKGVRGDLTRLILDKKFREKQNVTDDDLMNYVAIDSLQAYRLYAWQKEEIEQRGYAAIYDEAHKVQTDSMVDLLKIELDYTKMCIEMSQFGIRANLPYLKEELIKYTSLWKENLEKLGLTLETEELFRKPKWKQEYIFSRVDPPDNVDERIDFKLLTSTHLKKVEEGEATLSITKDSTKGWSFGKVAVGYYMEEYPDLIYMRYHADLETKIKDLNAFIRHSEYDGRVHFILTRATVTGRNSGKSPNTQNLRMKDKPPFYPKDSPVQKPGLDVGYLIADEGYQLISLDCSNAENWSAAKYGQDDTMAMACASDDFHKIMASTVYFADKWDSWDKEERKGWRNIGKNITFGRAYGMGVTRLARDIKVSMDFAKQIEANTDRKFWKIKKAKDNSKIYAEKNGYTVLWTGRRVVIRKIFNKKTKRVEIKGYTAWNSLAQGGVGEMIVRGMLRARQYLKENHYRSRVITQVHDELVLLIDPSEFQQIIVSIIELLSTVVYPLWNSRTTPECRWLFTFDPKEDQTKWGYNPYGEYLLPMDSYVNRWGFHQFGELKEAPNWINQWGYGENALNMELGNVEESPEIIVKEGIKWGSLRQTLTETLETLNTPVNIKDQTFIYPDNVVVAREFYHKQGDRTYLVILEALDKLGEVVERYKQWKN